MEMCMSVVIESDDSAYTFKETKMTFPIDDLCFPCGDFMITVISVLINSHIPFQFQ